MIDFSNERAIEHNLRHYCQNINNNSHTTNNWIKTHLITWKGYPSLIYEYIQQ